MHLQEKLQTHYNGLIIIIISNVITHLGIINFTSGRPMNEGSIAGGVKVLESKLEEMAMVLYLSL